MSKKILCIGEILWDSLPKGLFLGGAPFNVACHLNMLGEKTVICSRVGNDILGTQTIQRVSQQRINTDLIQIDANYDTGFVNVKLDSCGNAEYIINEPAAWDFIESNNFLIKEFNSCDFLVYGTLAQRNSVSKNTIDLLCSKQKINVYDVNLRAPFIDRNIIRESLLAANIVKMNEDEFIQIFEWFDLAHELEEGMRDLASKFNCDSVCVTKGKEGAALLHEDQYLFHEGFNVKIKDTVGSGDAFLAALLYGFRNNFENKNILKFANAAGAYVATKSGATPNLNLEKIKKIFNSKKFRKFQ